MIGMNRRQALIRMGAAAAGLTFPTYTKADGTRVVQAGWQHSPEARNEFIRTHQKPHLHQMGAAIKGTSRGKSVLLHQVYERVTKQTFKPHNQKHVGTCAAESSTLGAEFAAAIQIGLLKKNEEWRGKFAVEITYAGARIEIGKGRVSARFDGTTVAECARFLNEYGVVLRKKYGDLDLSIHDPDLARRLGRPGVGVPDELEAIAKEHPVQTVALVSSWDEAADCIANGHPVVIGSNIGYSYKTDKDGFLPQLEEWWHAMLLMGIDRRQGKREGGLWANSWPEKWVSGPKHELGTPAGCFWADARYIDRAIKQGDAFALSNFKGFPRRNLDYLLI